MIQPRFLKHKQYLGDGLYVGYDDYHVWLYTDNGISITNEVALEPEVIDNFIAWLKSEMDYKIK
jgi:hypothetical protein